ncbi:hypothetical protein BH11PSE6_BH11PSE6_03720 [soil metagenome]
MADHLGGNWLTCEQFAELTKIPLRTARHALKMAASGKPVKHWQVLVRVQPGRGGKSGLRYEVALSSLSEAYQVAFRGDVGNDFHAPAIGRPDRVAPNQSKTIEYRYRVIQEAIDQPRRSPERKAEIERASRKWGVPVRTIHRWIANAEAAGFDMNALGRKRPADAGKRRVWVSRRFDAAFLAAGHPADLLPELAEIADQLTRAAWASPVQRAGWKQVRREVITAFQRELRNRNLALAPAAFDLSQRRIVQAQHYRVVDIRAHDRKRYDDMKPRIRRDNTLLQPMAQIVMDVKPLDCIVRRPDGTTTWPKMIGFMDTGTHRIFRHYVLLPQGEGVRQEHVVEAFLRMVAHPEWGFPQQLYRDNGTEFYILDKIRDALALINEPGARTIINAKPYSGASKPIESKFAVLDRFVFSQMGGWAGGNRMNKKTQTVGKPTAPYAGSFDAFVQEAEQRIEIFEHQEIGSGPFKGKTPQGCFADHVANGWRPVRIHPALLDSAFCKRTTFVVRQAAIRWNGDRWRHPELASCNGQQVEVALPWRRDAHPLVNLPEFSWTYLAPEMLHLPGEIAGAIESGRMQKRSDGATRQLQRKAGAIDLEANRFDRVAILPTRAAPAPLIDLAMSEEAERFAGARVIADAHEEAVDDEAALRRRRRDAETRRLERKNRAS